MRRRTAESDTRAFNAYQAKQQRAAARREKSMAEPKHPFALFAYEDGTTREILAGRLGKDGKWYAYPVCNDCGKRRSAKVHQQGG